MGRIKEFLLECQNPTEAKTKEMRITTYKQIHLGTLQKTSLK
jgi:hypothetical protein